MAPMVPSAGGEAKRLPIDLYAWDPDWQPTDLKLERRTAPEQVRVGSTATLRFSVRNMGIRAATGVGCRSRRTRAACPSYVGPRSPVRSPPARRRPRPWSCRASARDSTVRVSVVTVEADATPRNNGMGDRNAGGFAPWVTTSQTDAHASRSPALRETASSAPPRQRPLLLAASLAGVGPASAGVGVWGPSYGPGGGAIEALAVDPENPKTVYAGTFRGVFKSTDGCRSWRAANAGLGKDPWVVALAVNPKEPATVYAGTVRDGVFKSMDGGGNWGAANAGLGDRTCGRLRSTPGGQRPLRSRPRRRLQEHRRRPTLASRERGWSRSQWVRRSRSTRGGRRLSTQASVTASSRDGRRPQLARRERRAWAPGLAALRSTPEAGDVYAGTDPAASSRARTAAVAGEPRAPIWRGSRCGRWRSIPKGRRSSTLAPAAVSSRARTAAAAGDA